MKKIIYFIIFIITLSCTQESVIDDVQMMAETDLDSFNSTEFVSDFMPTRSDSLLALFVDIEEEKYIVSISLEESMKFGITESEYNNFVLQVDAVNREIDECKSQGGDVILCVGKESSVDLPELRSLLGEGGGESTSPKCYAARQLRDGVQNLFYFAGYWKIELRASCTAPIWSILFEESSKNITKLLSGTLLSTTKETVSYGLSSGSGTVNWHWGVFKQAGTNCIATVSFYSVPN